MRSFFAIILLILFARSSFSQSFLFVDSQTGLAADSSYLRNVTDSLGDEFILHGVNLSGTSRQMKVRMTVMSTPSSCTNDIYFCDPIACYTSAVTLSLFPFTMNANDTSFSVLIPHMSPGNCCGNYSVNYCLFDIDHPEDSANVVMYYSVTGNHCFDDLGKIENEISFRIAPNPATGICNFTFEELPSNTVSSLVIYSAEGRLIYTCPLYANKLQVDVSSFPNGLYYYGIEFNNQISSFRKLIILNQQR
jgi:hypothetical protein